VLIDLANGVDGEFTTGLQGELVGIFIFWIAVINW
jgi:hypothetical protein